MAANPAAKAVYLCEETDVEGGMTNLYALFNAIRPEAYPHRQDAFVCVVQLVGGLGDVPFYIDIVRAEDGRLVDCSEVHILNFPDRDTQRQVALTFEGCVFERPGIYFVELHCNNVWVADTTFRLLEPRT